MEKRVLFAGALSLLVLIAFQYFFPQKEQNPSNQRIAQTTGTAPTAAKLPEKESETTPEALPGQTAALSASANDTHASPQTLIIEGDKYRAVLDNRGALLAGWELFGFKSAAGEKFEMITPGNDPNSRALPGMLFFDDQNTTGIANGQHYEVKITEGQNGSGRIIPPATVVMTLRRGTLSVEKTFRFDKQNYIVNISANSTKDGNPLPAQIFLAQDIGPEKEHLLNSSMILQAVYDLGGKIKRESPPKETDVKQVNGTILWAGLDMQYFSIIAVPKQPFAAFTYQKNTIKTKDLKGNELSRDLMRVKVSGDGSSQFGLYLGPKKKSDLEAVNGVDLTGVVDYGMFSFIVMPLLAALKWINQYAQNYGFSIIILTFLLTLALFPFRFKQMLSMKKMAVVQPKVKAIQEKYKKYKKTDPKRAEMNQEVMALYKEHGVNPLGGCVPMLLQLPLLFAFYSLLAYSIELRHAPFIGWIYDLSAPDAYYVIPVVMGISMFISQKMTPMTPGADPTQAKMMMFLPVVFTFMFFSYSSGLNLYFLCSNVFQIALQKISERWVGDRSPKVKSKA